MSNRCRIDVGLLGRALSLEWGPFWRESPIEDSDGVHSWEATFDKAAFTAAVAAEYDRLAADHVHSFEVMCLIDGRRNGCPEHFHLGPSMETSICSACGSAP